MKTLTLIFSIFACIGSCFAQMTGKELANSYIHDLNHNQFTSFDNYIDLSSFTKTPDRNYREAVLEMVKKKSISQEQANTFEAALIETGYTSEELGQLTLSDVFIELYLQMYPLVKGKMVNVKVESISLLTSYKESKTKEHFLFSIKQTTINDESAYADGFKIDEIEVVTVIYKDGKTFIKPPAMVDYYVKQFANILKPNS